MILYYGSHIVAGRITNEFTVDFGRFAFPVSGIYVAQTVADDAYAIVGYCNDRSYFDAKAAK